MTLPPIGVEAIGDVLRGTQGDLLASSGRNDRLVQSGGASLAEPFPLRMPRPGDPVHPVDGEPVIEMYMIGPDGRLEATGPDPAIADWWRPEVEALLERVRAGLADIGVQLVEPIHVTASATPVERVDTGPHLDDDQPRPTDGVGLVVVVATHLGPRLATEPLACRPVRPPAPVELEPGIVEGFGGPDGPVQQAPAERAVVFPRFGQLHAGPALAGATPGEVRNLLVLRAGTAPRAVPIAAPLAAPATSPT